MSSVLASSKVSSFAYLHVKVFYKHSFLFLLASHNESVHHDINQQTDLSITLKFKQLIIDNDQTMCYCATSAVIVFSNMTVQASAAETNKDCIVLAVILG